MKPEIPRFTDASLAANGLELISPGRGEAGRGRACLLHVLLTVTGGQQLPSVRHTLPPARGPGSSSLSSFVLDQFF